MLLLFLIEKGLDLLVEKKLYSFHPSILCLKFGFDWISGSREKNVVCCQCILAIISLWERAS